MSKMKAKNISLVEREPGYGLFLPKKPGKAWISYYCNFIVPSSKATNGLLFCRILFPKRNRDRGYSPAPFEIFPTDTICLGSSTRFMVMPMLG